MKTSEKNEYKGDIYFYWLKKHPEFIWNEGHVAMLNQHFIDYNQLLELGYGRIISRGKSYCKVEFMQKHPKLTYEKGKIVSLQLEQIRDNCLVSQGYVKLIFEELPPVKEVLEEDKVNARILKPGGNRSEKEGSIIRISEAEAERLLDVGLIELMADDYVEPLVPPLVYDEKEWASVICKNSHSEYAYSPGQTGKIVKKQLRKLLEGGYFDLAPSYSSKERSQILSELKFQKDPITDKILKPCNLTD
jgi:hypothetical protein